MKNKQKKPTKFKPCEVFSLHTSESVKHLRLSSENTWQGKRPSPIAGLSVTTPPPKVLYKTPAWPDLIVTVAFEKSIITATTKSTKKIS